MTGILTNKQECFRKTARIGGKILIWAILIAGSLVMIYPIVFMLLAGFFTKSEYWTTTLTLFPIPKNPTLVNYLALLDVSRSEDILWPAFNTLMITAVTTGFSVITVLFCAYAFTRLKWKGSSAVFFTLLAAGMLPGQLSLIPRYIMYAQMGILDTYWVYFIGLPCINTMGTFITIQYFRSIPAALDESAKMDGANHFTIMFRIILPIAKPIFGYIIISTAIGTWNSWFTGFFFTEDIKYRTLPAVLSALAIEPSGVPDYPFMITLGLLITIPTLIIYFIFQKYIIEGLAASGIKG